MSVLDEFSLEGRPNFLKELKTKKNSSSKLPPELSGKRYDAHNPMHLESDANERREQILSRVVFGLPEIKESFKERIYSSREKDFGFIEVHGRNKPSWIRPVAPGLEVYNIITGEWTTSDSQNSILFSGTCGEQWITNKAVLREHYFLPRSSKGFRNGWFRCHGVSNEYSPATVWVFPLAFVDFGVNNNGVMLMGNQAGLSHNWGDLLVAKREVTFNERNRRWRPDFTTLSVMNGELFSYSYQLIKDGVKKYTRNRDNANVPPVPFDCATTVEKALQLFNYSITTRYSPHSSDSQP